MSSNDVILLADMLERDRALADPDLTQSEHEVYFSAKHYLRFFRPTNDDLLSGIVDASRDGGLDGIYIYANSLCIRDDVPISALGKQVQLDLFLFQVKNTAGFGETAIDKLIVALPKLLDFSRDEAALSKVYNERVIEITRRFLNAYRQLELPSLRIFVSFVSLKAEDLHANTKAKGDELAQTLLRCFGACEPEIHFLDAAKLADMVRDRPVTTRSLALAENPISTDTVGGYVAVVRLKDYERFITGENGELDSSLFEANVRDYEGDVLVNRSIQETLEQDDKDVDFWWLNNGVTIVASRVQPANKLLEMESPQVVNGLQTSNEIYKRQRSGVVVDDRRSLLIKVIQARDEKVRDRIIRATNSQTSLGPSALRATDKVQRQIEEYLSKHGLHYERRRRFYENQGVPQATLVSIDRMGQSLLSVLVQTPHVARGGVSRIFDDEIYDLLFAPGHPIPVYLAAYRIANTCDVFLRRNSETKPQSENFVFHLAMMSAIAMTRKQRPSSADVAKLEGVPSAALLSEMLDLVQQEFVRTGRTLETSLLDQIAKSEAATKGLIERGRIYLTRPAR